MTALTALLGEDKESQDTTKVSCGGNLGAYLNRMFNSDMSSLQYYFTALLYATAGITLVKFVGVSQAES